MYSELRKINKMLSLGQYSVIVLSTYFEEDVINLVFVVTTFIAMYSYPCRLVYGL